MKKNLIPASVFICGACVMILQLVGSRILAPFFGTSTAIWASLIGIMLGAMAIGYKAGGKLADKNPNYGMLSLIIGAAAASVALVGMLRNDVFSLFIAADMQPTQSAFTAILLLFAIPSMLLAMVSPYAMKLSIDSLETSGSTAGNVYAFGTFGSITGTFLAGFVLIPLFANATIIAVISVTLLVLSLLLSVQGYRVLRITIIVLVLLSVFVRSGLSQVFAGVIAEYDTRYSTILIIDSGNVRTLRGGVVNQSRMLLDSDELIPKYIRMGYLYKVFNPNATRMMMLGGAGYTFPQHFLRNHPNKYIDVVEIDPQVTQIAREYFGLTDNPRMNIFHEDGRMFLNRREKRYDVIFGNAFGSALPPFQLVTREAKQAIYDSLEDDGVYIALVLGGLEGSVARYFNAFYNTLAEVFSQILVFQASDVERAPGEFQEIMLVALKQPIDVEAAMVPWRDDSFIGPMLERQWNHVPNNARILTDERAPIESLMWH